MFDIQHLSFAYSDEPDRLVLEDIDVHVDDGEFVCLLGQSGCGKSTFLRLMAGLETPTSGAIRMDGTPVRGTSLDRSVVFQDYGLFPWMSAGENILMALAQKNPGARKAELRERVFELLDMVGLDRKVYKQFPKALSGGMKQRCAIARAFGIDPPVLLMDEPFGALDAVTRARLQDLVLDLCAHQSPRKTVFFVTHDVDEALLLATRILVFGLSPSHIIYDCSRRREDIPGREDLYDHVETLKLRNTLISHINKDVVRHEME